MTTATVAITTTWSGNKKQTLQTHQRQRREYFERRLYAEANTHAQYSSGHIQWQARANRQPPQVQTTTIQPRHFISSPTTTLPPLHHHPTTFLLPFDDIFLPHSIADRDVPALILFWVPEFLFTCYHFFLPHTRPPPSLLPFYNKSACVYITSNTM